jgi:protein-tyrosine-phosphatase
VLGEYVGRTGPEAEVGDPFGSDLEVYRETYEQLDELIREAADRIEEAYRDADHGA